MASVSIRDLNKVYGNGAEAGTRVVHGINLEIKDREFMVLVGPSGCGKSTTLRMIAGLEDISGGIISIGDITVNDVLPKDRDIAMVFQNYALYPHMSVRENMAFGLKLRKMPRSEIDSRVQEAAVMLGLEGVLDRKPKSLSGGQRQRVAVGRAIVRKPKVFLFDEPLSNLDAKMRVSMRAEISKLHARLGVTMVYVTHDQVEAMTMGDRICVMKDGRIMQVATPLDLYNHPANMFVAGFIGSPPMNFFKGEIRSGQCGIQFVEQNTEAPPVTVTVGKEHLTGATRYRDKPIVLGIRPEDIDEAGAEVAMQNIETSTASIERAEPMGAETFLNLTTGATPFIVRVRPSDRYATDQTIRVRLNPSRIHLFDPESGDVILR